MTRSRALSLSLGIVVALALSFALFTSHVWEDYYITYRSSKHLATGNGLVYNLGDKLHTFTSPLGVLLPAAASLITGNTSDTGALWIFRLMCSLALGGAAICLIQIGHRLRYSSLVIFFLTAWFVTDVKTLDFTINGMETGFLLFFLAYTIRAHLTPGPRQWCHLGGAWAGLMWTRPDSFIYIGLLAMGCWLFNDQSKTELTRSQLIGLFLRAGLVTTALYLPWLLLAWKYYGTAVPHTITAKSGFGNPHTLAGLLRTAWEMPWLAWTNRASLELTYLPSYYMLGGWPPTLVIFSRCIATISATLWLIPKLRFEIRLTSFAFFGAHLYLTYFPYFPFPWYIPSTTLLSTIALSGLLAQLLGWHRRLTTALLGGATLWLFLNFWLIFQVGRQLKSQQMYIENGTRQKIGEWLQQHSHSGDAVFMEPLGYIGFFSGLKTYDFPGMSSLEMVRARQLVGNDWSLLIPYLAPQWVVLRPHEAARIREVMPALLTEIYSPVKQFDQRAEVAKLTIFGRAYLEHDASFTIYERQRVVRHSNTLGDILSYFPPGPRSLDGKNLIMVHAPSTIIIPLPPEAKKLSIYYGYAEPGAYQTTDHPTDGATFGIDFILQTRLTHLATHTLNPTAVTSDRGLKQFQITLPAHESEATLLLRIYPGKNTDRDWTCWGYPEFK